MIFTGVRRWLPPACLAALIATVWLLPYRPNCAALAPGDDPAVARVGDECIRLSGYAERLGFIEVGIQLAEDELLSDDPNLAYLRRWYDRATHYGPETVALAVVISDSALHQRAVASGHTPTEEEVSAQRDLSRLRSENESDYVDLMKFAQNQDLAGFSQLLEESTHPDISDSPLNFSPSDWMASLENADWRQLEQSLKEGEAYLESVGREHYWNEIYAAKLRREMTFNMLEEAVLDATGDGPYAEVPRLAWLSYQEEVLDNIDIKLTEAAPATVSTDRALAYLAELLATERDTLREEYRRFLERREERQRRQRLTPPPPPPISN